MGDEKDILIGSLQEEVQLLWRQVGEFNDLRFSVVKVTGKNSIRKLKMKVLTSSDKLNAHEIGHWLRKSLWPHVKMMPDKWHKWSEHPKSIRQRIMTVIGVLKGCTMEDYWLSVARTAANDKLCALRSNMKQSMFTQFKGEAL
jgi:lysyl-tRNA synthetase class II